MDLEKIESIMGWPIVKDVINIRSIMGLVRCYMIVIEGFSRILYPTASLQNKGKNFKWTSRCEESF